MMTEDFETDLRRALTGVAADVPAEVGRRLQSYRYHPRSSYRGTGVGVAAATVVVVVGVGVGVRQPAPPGQAGTTTTSPQHPATPLHLAAATIPLPLGSGSISGLCPTTAAGSAPKIEFSGDPAAAASATAAAHGGCINVLLAKGGAIPSGLTSVPFGPYRVALSTDPTTGVTTLYLQPPTGEQADAARFNLDLVLTAKGLTINEVPVTSDTAPTQSPTGSGPCPGGCG
jgi:hypothetical protein